MVVGFSAPSVDFPTSAFKLVESGLNQLHHTYTIVGGLTSGADYYHSFYLKQGERKNVFLATEGATTFGASFDLSTGTELFNNTGADSKIEPLADDWYRISILANTGTTNRIPQIFILADSYTTGPAVAYTGNGTSGVYIFMAQLEQSSVATSPTFTDTTLASEGSTTTRLVDVVSGAGDVNTFNSVEGVIEIEIKASDTSATLKAISINDGTSSNRIIIYFFSNFIGLEYQIGGVATYIYNYTVGTITDYNTYKLKWKANDFGVKVNGVEVDTQLSGSVLSANTLTSLDFTEGLPASNMFANIKNIKIYNDITNY